MWLCYCRCCWWWCTKPARFLSDWMAPVGIYWGLGDDDLNYNLCHHLRALGYPHQVCGELKKRQKVGTKQSEIGGKKPRFSGWWSFPPIFMAHFLGYTMVYVMYFPHREPRGAAVHRHAQRQYQSRPFRPVCRRNPDFSWRFQMGVSIHIINRVFQ